MRHADNEPIAQASNRLLFTAACGLGVIAVVLGPSFIPGLWVHVPPLAVMLFYAAVVLRQGSITTESCDNVYFLGFIFTLLALIVSTARVATSEAVIDVLPIVRSFGLALSTTVVGLAARVILLTFVPDGTDEAHEAARSGAISALVELRLETRLVVQGMAEWRDHASRHWLEIRDHELTAVRSASREHSELLRSETGQLFDAFRACRNEMRDVTAQSLAGINEAAAATMAGIRLLVENVLPGMQVAAAQARASIEAEFAGVAGAFEAEIDGARESVQQGAKDLGTASREVEDSLRGAAVAISASLTRGAAQVDRAFIAGAAEFSSKFGGAAEPITDAASRLAHTLSATAVRVDRLPFEKAAGAIWARRSESRPFAARKVDHLRA